MPLKRREFSIQENKTLAAGAQVRQVLSAAWNGGEHPHGPASVHIPWVLLPTPFGRVYPVLKDTTMFSNG